jgi:hypothetical protein
MSPSPATIPIILLFSASAQAQVYKCQNEQQQVIYADSPCPAGNTEFVTDIKLYEPDSDHLSAYNLSDSPNLMRRLDGAVKSAILAGDLIKAGALASTIEQKQWVAEAQLQQNNQPQKSDAMLKAEMASSAACQNARRNLENEANARLPDTRALEAKRSLMHSACGSTKPLIVQQTVASGFAYRYPHRFRYNEYQKHPGHPYETTHRPSVELPLQQKSSTSSTYPKPFRIKSAQ